MRPALALLLLTLGAPLAAEVIPEPGPASPRIQTVQWRAGETIQLTALPATGLTFLFEPGEEVISFAADPAMLDARIAHERNAMQLFPLREGPLGALRVITSRRSYTFSVRTGSDLMAAYLVRLVSGPMPALPAAMATMPQPGFPPVQAPAVSGQSTWSYRLKGDNVVRPAGISDDGIRTTIIFPEGSALPAVFAIGPAGEEQLVNGYMRDGHLMIDEVWQEFVFRIDARKASARRNRAPDGQNG